MKRFIYTLVPVLFSLSTIAQNDFYLFIQQSSGQPFYVRMGEKSYSSSWGGHLLLAGLQDTGYNVVVGFPKEAEPEQLFMVPMQGKDKGYELKNMNGIWELFDLQTFKFIKATVMHKKVVEQGIRKTDGYSQLMADVVDDSTVQYATIAMVEEPKPVQKAIVPAVAVKKENKPKKKEEEKKEPEIKNAAEAGNDTAALKDTAVIAAQPVAVAAKPVRADIVRYGSENTEEGKEIIYLDRTAPVIDTIRIMIPRL